MYSMDLLQLDHMMNKWKSTLSMIGQVDMPKMDVSMSATFTLRIETSIEVTLIMVCP